MRGRRRRGGWGWRGGDGREIRDVGHGLQQRRAVEAAGLGQRQQQVLDGHVLVLQGLGLGEGSAERIKKEIGSACPPEDGEGRGGRETSARQRHVGGSLELGGPDHSDVLNHVPVMFMSDDDTGGYSLMGMSVLGRYNMTIEDAENQIILVKRR